METVAIIGLDLAKRSFQVHGASFDGTVLFREKTVSGTSYAFFCATTTLQGRHGGLRDRA